MSGKETFYEVLGFLNFGLDILVVGRIRGR